MLYASLNSILILSLSFQLVQFLNIHKNFAVNMRYCIYKVFAVKVYYLENIISHFPFLHRNKDKILSFEHFLFHTQRIDICVHRFRQKANSLDYYVATISQLDKALLSAVGRYMPLNTQDKDCILHLLHQFRDILMRLRLSISYRHYIIFRDIIKG